MATIVDIDRISWAARSSIVLPLISLVLISSPRATARLATTSATMPAARLVIQNRCGPAFVVMTAGSPSCARGACARAKTSVGGSAAWVDQVAGAGRRRAGAEQRVVQSDRGEGDLK